MSTRADPGTGQQHFTVQCSCLLRRLPPTLMARPAASNCPGPASKLCVRFRFRFLEYPLPNVDPKTASNFPSPIFWSRPIFQISASDFLSWKRSSFQKSDACRKLDARRACVQFSGRVRFLKTTTFPTQKIGRGDLENRTRPQNRTRKIGRSFWIHIRKRIFEKSEPKSDAPFGRGPGTIGRGRSGHECRREPAEQPNRTVKWRCPWSGPRHELSWRARPLRGRSPIFSGLAVNSIQKTYKCRATCGMGRGERLGVHPFGPVRGTRKPLQAHKGGGMRAAHETKRFGSPCWSGLGYDFEVWSCAVSPAGVAYQLSCGGRRIPRNRGMRVSAVPPGGGCTKKKYMYMYIHELWQRSSTGQNANSEAASAFCGGLWRSVSRRSGREPVCLRAAVV